MAQIIRNYFYLTQRAQRAQINEKDYSLPFTADGRKVIKIGANITSATRNIERWMVEG